MTRPFKDGEFCLDCGTNERPHHARGLCVNCYARLARRENPEGYKKTQKKYTQTDKRKKWLVEYKKGNTYKTMIKKSSEKYRNNNKELVLERTRVWRLNNPDKIEAYKSTEKDLKIVNNYGENALRVMREAKYKCQKCGSSKRVAIHHIDWNKENGAYDNFAILCGSCHSKLHGCIPSCQGHEMFEEWFNTVT